MQRKILCFFTNQYPYGSSETFIGNELAAIADKFDEILIFPRYQASIVREIPSNVKIVFISPPPAGHRNKSYALFFFLVLHELWFSRQKRLFLKRFRYNLSYLKNAIYYAYAIDELFTPEQKKEMLFYSYWFSDWNLSLSILKFGKRIVKSVSRAHGFDVYEDNGKPNFLPSRSFSFRNTDIVFTISLFTERYLKNLYPGYSGKVRCSYLGTKDCGMNPSPVPGGQFHIVSCSNVIPVKRLHLIVEMLKQLNIPVSWTHIGDGPLLNEIKRASETLPSNVTVVFKGRLTQESIFEFYLTTPVDLFINCSASEGLPVSIMEAISFGIPVLATDVGGTSEIVNEQTGFLVDPHSEEVAKIIRELWSEDLIALRETARTFWEQSFNAHNNYSKFINYLLVEKYLLQ
jgi:glycosyltransferase involved in cell wall biosynthesis